MPNALSKDAEILCGIWFNGGLDTKVTLHLVENRPTARTQAVLDELVSAGVITVEPFNRFGGLVYQGTERCREIFKELGGFAGLMKATAPTKGEWRMVEPISKPARRKKPRHAPVSGEGE